jgi:hypothetical protein
MRAPEQAFRTIVIKFAESLLDLPIWKASISHSWPVLNTISQQWVQTFERSVDELVEEP